MNPGDEDDIFEALRGLNRERIAEIRKETANCLRPSRLIELSFEPSSATPGEDLHLSMCKYCSRYKEKLAKISHPDIELLILYKNDQLDPVDQQAIWWHLFPWCSRCRGHLRGIQKLS